MAIITLKELQNTNKEIIIFGSGKIGKLVLDICLSNNINVKCFCDNNPQLSGTISELSEKKHQKQIFSLNQLNEKTEKIFIISVFKNDIVFQIQEQLNQNNFYNILTLKDFYNLESQDMKTNFKEKIRIDNFLLSQLDKKSNTSCIHFLQMQITERCSLKCKHCANFMQYYEKPVDYDFEDIKSYIDKLCDTFDMIYDFQFLGGELFMHKNWLDILMYACNKSNIKIVRFITNATIVPNIEDLKKLDNNKLFCLISVYDEVLQDIKGFCKALDQSNISYDVRYDIIWNDITIRENAHIPTDKLEKYYDNCSIKYNCSMLLDGKIFACPQAANMYNLDIIPKDQSDYVDIMDNNLSKAELRIKLTDFLMRKKYVNECQYCTKATEGELPPIPRAEQINKHLPLKKYS